MQQGGVIGGDRLKLSWGAHPTRTYPKTTGNDMSTKTEIKDLIKLRTEAYNKSLRSLKAKEDFSIESEEFKQLVSDYKESLCGFALLLALAK